MQQVGAMTSVLGPKTALSVPKLGVSQGEGLLGETRTCSA